jgi:predicted kinase
MAGSPGAGKTALASALGPSFGAVVLDRDVIKSALLGAEVEWAAAGAATQEVMLELADSLLAQGQSVVLDSPSHFAPIPQRGSAIAVARFAKYRFIECVCDDLEEVSRRLVGRERRRSQWGNLDVQSADGNSSAEQIGPHRWRTYGPAGGWLVLDTREPLEVSLIIARRYVIGRGPARETLAD